MAEASTTPEATIHLVVGIRIASVEYLRDLGYTFSSQPH